MTSGLVESCDCSCRILDDTEPPVAEGSWFDHHHATKLRAARDARIEILAPASDHAGGMSSLMPRAWQTPVTVVALSGVFIEKSE